MAEEKELTAVDDDRIDMTTTRRVQIADGSTTVTNIIHSSTDDPEYGSSKFVNSKPTTSHTTTTTRGSTYVPKFSFKKFGAGTIFIASLFLVVGLALISSSQLQTSGGSRREETATATIIPAAHYIQSTRLSYFDESVIRGYPDIEETTSGDDHGDRDDEDGAARRRRSGCLNLKDDLYEAVEIMTNVTIYQNAIHWFHSGYWTPCTIDRGLGSSCLLRSTTFTDEGSSTQEWAEPTSGEYSYGTNNQVEGVDEADQVKSDGTHVFAGYGSQLIVWNATNGKRLSTTELTFYEDEDGYGMCAESDPIFPCYQHRWNSHDQDLSSPFEIKSFLIHDEDRLLVVAEARNFVLMEDKHTKIREKPFYSNVLTRLFLYDIDPSNIPSDNTALNLIASKDILGTYQTGRKIGQYAHIVTSSSLDTRYAFAWKIGPWNEEFKDMDEDEYRAEAYKMSLELGRKFVDDLFEELSRFLKNDDGSNDCANIAKIALMMKSNSESNNSTFDHLPPFSTSVALQTFTQVYSIDLLQDPLIHIPDDVDDEDKDSNTLKPKIKLSVSGTFFPTASYTPNVYASADKLFIAGESYVEDDDGQWKEHTIFLVYDFKDNATEATAIGDVPGSLLNQFSMDHSTDDNTGEEHLRVATTSWARWGIADDGSWEQTDESESSVFVLKLPNGEQGSTAVMDIVGSATGIGLGERIYAVRFLGDKGYIVTFRQIDPFYTLDLANHTEPVVVGELKIPGFSNYLHPVSDDLILGLGQDADERGVMNGLQISLFNVSTFESPTLVRQFVEEDGSSAAQYEHKAFRYLPESKLLILPVSTSWWDDDVEYFDGFIVYDVDESKDFEKKFNISHMEGRKADDYCWSQNTLPSRSLVFNGDVTTLKGHNVYSHNLEKGKYLWDVNLDDGRNEENGDYCIGWAWPW